MKVVACDIVQNFAKQFPESLVLEMEWLVQPLSVLVHDGKKR